MFVAVLQDSSIYNILAENSTSVIGDFHEYMGPLIMKLPDDLWPYVIRIDDCYEDEEGYYDNDENEGMVWDPFDFETHSMDNTNIKNNKNIYRDVSIAFQ